MYSLYSVLSQSKDFLNYLDASVFAVIIHYM